MAAPSAPALFSALLLLAAAAAPGAPAGQLREILQKKRQAAAQEEPARADFEDGKVSPAALPPGCTVLSDQAYGEDRQQRLDVYLPKSPDKAPVLFMVHGGAWMFGDKAGGKVIANKAALLLPKGYVIASPNYRMSKSPDPLQQAGDAALALAYVQAHCADWGCDPEKVLLMGHSAGAHLVSLLAADPAIASAGTAPWLGTVSLDSAMLDAVATMSAKHYRFYDRVFGKDRRRWERASPYHRLKAAPAPMLLVCSLKRSDSCPQARAFAGKIVSLGGRAEVLPVELDHGRVNSDLGLPGAYTDKVAAFMRSLGLP